MERRHEEELIARLERAYLDGYSFVSWSELYYWYDVQKIASKTWRDLHEKWNEVVGDEKNQLLTLEGRGGLHLVASITRGDHHIQKLSVMAGLD